MLQISEIITQCGGIFKDSGSLFLAFPPEEEGGAELFDFADFHSGDRPLIESFADGGGDNAIGMSRLFRALWNKSIRR